MVDITKLDLTLQYHVIGSSKRGGAVQRKTSKGWESIFYGTYWECNAYDAEIERLKRAP